MDGKGVLVMNDGMLAMSILMVALVVMLVVALVAVLACNIVRAKKNVREQREQDEWLEALLVPSVSLATLAHSLNTVFPDVMRMRADSIICIKLTEASRYFSDSMMWKLIDVFVRNADTHFQVLSNGREKDGASLVRHIMTEIMELHGRNAMKAINGSSLSKEAKQKLLS